MIHQRQDPRQELLPALSLPRGHVFKQFYDPFEQLSKSILVSVLFLKELQHVAEEAAFPRQGFDRDFRKIQEVRLELRNHGLEAAALLHKHGWRTAVLLAHACHVPRATAVWEKLGLAAVVPPGLERVRFCRGSRQLWTRNRVLWFLREVPTLGYYRTRGWI